MKNTPSAPRGDLRLASFLFVVVVTLGGVSPGVAARIEGAQPYTVRLTIGATGFEPKRLSVPIGTVRFVVTSRAGDHCFAIPTLDVEKRVRASRPLEVDVTFERAGEWPFLCCAESPGSAETGMIVVTPGR